MSSKIQTFLVDDESLARKRMNRLLKDSQDIEVVGEFSNGADCIDATLAKSPDLIFLDIGLPDHNGLEVVSELAAECETLPLIVFVTAFDEHAIAAFEVNAIDYLLKPVKIERLQQTLERVRAAMLSRQTEANKLRNWMQSESQSDDEPEFLNKLEIKDASGITYVSVDDIHLLQADGNYIEVYTRGRVHLLRMTMAKLEKQLDPGCFIRISRSAIIAAPRVVSIEKKGRYDSWVKLDTDDRIGATRNLDTLQRILKGG